MLSPGWREFGSMTLLGSTAVSSECQKTIHDKRERSPDSPQRPRIHRFRRTFLDHSRTTVCSSKALGRNPISVNDCWPCNLCSCDVCDKDAPVPVLDGDGLDVHFGS